MGHPSLVVELVHSHTTILHRGLPLLSSDDVITGNLTSPGERIRLEWPFLLALSNPVAMQIASNQSGQSDLGLKIRVSEGFSVSHRP